MDKAVVFRTVSVLLLCVYSQFGDLHAVSARVSQACCGLTRSLGCDAFSLV